MRESFAQVASDDALNALIDLDNTLTGTSAQYHTDRKAKKLLMQKWTWVGEGRKTAGRKELKRVIEEELDRFARFQLAE